jgi:hypothetical protein
MLKHLLLLFVGLNIEHFEMLVFICYWLVTVTVAVLSD